MATKYNPFTDALDFVGSGGGTSYIDGDVEYHSDLPVTVGTPAVNSAFLVRKGEGLYFISRKPAGIWVRELNNGNLDDWKYAGTFSDLYRDANFRILNDADVTKELALDVSGLTTGTTRTLTAPDASGTIARTEDFASPPAIGNTTPNTGAFTTLTASSGSITANAPLKVTQTWNNAAVAFTALEIDVTNTAASTASRLIYVTPDGGSQYFMVNRVGGIEVQRSSTTVSGISTNARVTAGGAVLAANHTVMDSNGFNLASNRSILWSSITSYGGTPDLRLERDDAGTLGQRNATNPQTFRLYTTYGGTGGADFERLFIKGNTGGAFQIGTEKGGSGSARALEFQTDGVTRLGISTAGVLTVTATNTLTVTPNATSSLMGGAACVRLDAVRISLATGGTDRLALSSGGDAFLATSANFQWSSRSRFSSPADGQILLRDAAGSSFDRLQFGGTTSSFPALKRDTTNLQVKLADDSAFTAIQGKLTTETAYTAGAPTATGYLVLYDSNGTAYKVPAEAL